MISLLILQIDNKIYINYSKPNVSSIIFSKDFIFINGFYEYKFYEKYYVMRFYYPKRNKNEKSVGATSARNEENEYNETEKNKNEILDILKNENLNDEELNILLKLKRKYEKDNKFYKICKYPLILNKDNGEYINVYLKPKSKKYLNYKDINFTYFNISEKNEHSFCLTKLKTDNICANVAISSSLSFDYNELYNEFNTHSQESITTLKFDGGCYCYL